MSRHVTQLQRYRRTLVLVTAALAAAGCSMQMAKSERPDWSLNGPKSANAQPRAQPKKYGDWNGAAAPQPLTYEPAR